MDFYRASQKLLREEAEFSCLLAQRAQCHHALVLAEPGLASWVTFPDVCGGKGATLASSP